MSAATFHSRGGHRIAVRLWVLLIALTVIVTRWPFIADAPLMSKDGPLYIQSLRLDRSYCVPMPGNIGYVLLGRLASRIWSEPTRAFAAVNAGLTISAAISVFHLARRSATTALAGFTSLALLCNPTVWWHGETINSYLVWLAVLPAIALSGLDYLDRRTTRSLVLLAAALGLGTVLRQDLLVFGTPLALSFLVRARAPWRHWLLAAGIVAACCVFWFAATSAILGGAARYLASVQAKHAGHMEGFSPGHRGLLEGLVRNASKLGLFLAWSAPLVVAAALAWLAMGSGSLNRKWRPLLVGSIWMAPSLAFSLFVFAGNAGLIFALLPPLYLAAGGFLRCWLGGDESRIPGVAMALIAAAGAMQFLGAPLLPETNQRNAILNVTFLRYSAPGLRARLDRNLDDYGIDPSLKNVMRQMRDPEPIPGRLAMTPGSPPR